MRALEAFSDKYSLTTRILGTSFGGVYAGVVSFIRLRRQ